MKDSDKKNENEIIKNGLVQSADKEVFAVMAFTFTHTVLTASAVVTPKDAAAPII